MSELENRRPLKTRGQGWSRAVGLLVTGAVAIGALTAGGIAFGLGCAFCGCGWWWKRRRGRRGPD